MSFHRQLRPGLRQSQRRYGLTSGDDARRTLQRLDGDELDTGTGREHGREEKRIVKVITVATGVRRSGAAWTAVQVRSAVLSKEYEWSRR